MMAAPSLRSALLPTRATLDLPRLAFLLRVTPLDGFRRPMALFDGHGGQLSSYRSASDLPRDPQGRFASRTLPLPGVAT